MVFAAVKKDGAGKRRQKQNAIEKHSEERKDTKTQNLADERRITGRFAKRFSGERPVSLGFELTFLSEFSKFVWRVLDRDAKRRACIVKHPPKCHLKFFKNSTSANSIAVEKNYFLWYNISRGEILCPND